MKTLNHHINVTCEKCKQPVGIALTLTNVQKAYGSVSFTCVCGNYQTHNYYGTSDEANGEVPEKELLNATVGVVRTR